MGETRTLPEGRMGPAETHAGQVADGGVVGRGGSKVDGRAKVVGTACYTDDIKLPRMVWAKVLRSPHPHARILKIEAGEAMAMAGVLDIITGEDVSVRYGALPVARDETALAFGKVRYVGEPVACVAAVDERTAWEACRRINVVYEILEPVLGVADAMDRGKPVIHDHARKKSNILRRVVQSFGDVDAGFDEADLVLEDTYSYPGSTHVPLEPQATLASWDGERMKVWTSTQNPHYLHRSLAQVLNLEVSQVRVIKPEVGAGYGGKCEPFVTDVCACVLSRRLGRPVKMALEREEVFYAHRGRHPVDMKVKMGMTRNGTITALQLEALADGGAYASYGVVTAYYLGVFGTLPYQLDNYAFTAVRCYTNKPPCGPKRGHGAVQPRFAIEAHLDRMCVALDLDPAQIRQKLAVQANSETINGLRVTSVGLTECIQRAVAASGFNNKRGRLPEGRGVGIAASVYMCGALHPVYRNEMPHSTVQLKADRSGRVTIFSGTSDVGQGSNTMLAVLVAERLGIDPSDCTVVEADTDLTPVDLGSYSSRVTFMAGNAALQAADRLRDRVFQVVADHWEVHRSTLSAKGGEVVCGERTMAWPDAVVLAEGRLGGLGAMGSYRPGKVGSRFRRSSVGPSPAYSFTAQVAEVTVDVESGFVSVDRIWCAHDLGRVLHPEVAEGQVEGCVYMGVGEALLEEQRYFDDGVIVAPSILEYKIPTVFDTPEIHPILVESHDPGGPFGAKEVGEGPQLSTVPAIANAIYDAVGVRMNHPPFTPDRVLRALRRR